MYGYSIQGHRFCRMVPAMNREQPALPAIQGGRGTWEPQGVAPRDLSGLVALPLLVTKLAIPTPTPTLVARPRLTARLQAAEACRLALVSAPAGSGKSTVVSQWCQEQAAGRVAWLSLDADDNEPRRFLRYLCAALERVMPGVATPDALKGACPVWRGADGKGPGDTGTSPAAYPTRYALEPEVRVFQTSPKLREDFAQILRCFCAPSLQ